MYKELSQGMYHSGIIVPAGEIKTAPSEKERYCSMFSFDESMLDYVKIHKSVANFNGICYAQALWIDIDVKDNLESARLQTLKFITRLNREYGVSPDDLFIYFSGGKGFHIALPSKLFGEFMPSKNLPAQIKQLAISLAGEIKIDTSIYEAVRIFRINNSKHSSGYYKIEVGFDELAFHIDYILGLAKNPRTDFKREKSINQIFKNDGLLKEWENVKKFEHEQKETKGGVGFWKPDDDGNRHTQLYRQAAMLFDKSELSKQAVYDIMFAINQMCSPPIDDLKELVESAFKKTQKNIKTGELILKPFAGWVEQYIDYIFHPSSNLSTGFKSFDKALRNKLKGKLCCKVGYGGSKKSLSALNAAMMNIQNYGCHVIYSTMEMSAIKLMDRIVDYIVDGEYTNASNELERLTKEQARKLLSEKVAPMLGNKLMITENGSLKGEDYERLIERMINETGRLDMLVVDGLSMMGGFEKEVDRYSQNSKELKELANKWNIYIELICHVSKGADKQTRDLTDKVRGSEKIFDNCDFMITLSQIVDLERSGSEVTEYMTNKGYARFYDKRGTGQTINKIYTFDSCKLTMTESDEWADSYDKKKTIRRKDDFNID